MRNHPKRGYEVGALPTRSNRGVRHARRWAGLLAALGLAASLVVTAVDSSVPAVVAAADSGPVTLSVIDSKDKSTIGSFEFLLNVDNTGTTEQRTPADGCNPDVAPVWVDATGNAVPVDGNGDPINPDPSLTKQPGYPDSCHWTSMGIRSSSPIYAQGTAADWASAKTLPAGRYLISVLADGHKLDGVHFTVPDDTTNEDGTAKPVVVSLHRANADPPNADGSRNSLPDATIQSAVFEDISPVNSAPDLPAEHGLAGFTGTIRDTLGTVTTDVYGDPLCGNGVCLSYCYVVDGGHDVGLTPSAADGRCPSDPAGLKMYVLDDVNSPFPSLADIAAGATVDVPDTAAIEGKIKIPHVGPNRYTLSVTPPDGTDFIQTTTLEGNHDWDAWVMEGATGLDTEFTQGGEPFPGIIFGYVPSINKNKPVSRRSTAKITGLVDYVKVYVPTAGGTTQAGQIWGGAAGGKIDKPAAGAWVTLSDLSNGDTMVAITQTDKDGKYTFNQVANGSYTVTWWDEPQDYILDLQNVTVQNQQNEDMGTMPLTGWWTTYDGYVFNDTNRNGQMDWNDTNGNGCPDIGEGEMGVPNYTLTMRRRENTLMDRGTTVVGTDSCGKYSMESAYPMTQWLVIEAYNDLYYTTGVTYQADNQPEPTTVMGAGVDVSTLPIIGLSGRLDWGVHSYDAAGKTNGLDPRNGGIVGTVSYDTTRNELNPQYAAVEDWQPGVSGLNVDLYAPVKCPAGAHTGVNCSSDGRYVLAADGSYKQGQLLNTYVTETWQQPGANGNANGDGECIPRDVDGNPILDQKITKAPYSDCLEAPLMGIQFQKGFSTVDGNYGFGDGCQVPGFPFNPDTGKCEKVTPAVAPCPVGATKDGNNCVTTVAAAETLVCSNGSTLVGPDCIGTVPADVTYTCTDPAVLDGTGTGCVTTLGAPVNNLCDVGSPVGDPPACVVTTDAVPSYSCPTGTLNGTNCDGVLVAAPTTDYSCTSPAVLNGTNCVTTVPVAAPCPANAVLSADKATCLESTDPQTLAGGVDYLVHVNNAQDAENKDIYTFTKEEDINIANGDVFSPQQPPPACVGALHTVDVKGIAPDGLDAVDNQPFVDMGGSPYEGMAKPLCDTKLVPLANGRSIVPTFNVFTKVPLPARFWGLVVDDLNFSSDPHQISYGEKAGVPFAPVGIYDFTNRLEYTTESDYSGLFDVLMPSTNRISCPTPSGVCANVYRFVGNDPGTKDQLNANFRPEFRTIAAEFEAMPGSIIPADLAPTQVGVSVQMPGGQANLVQCAVSPSTPEIFAVSAPFVARTGTITVSGQGFGDAPPATNAVTLGGNTSGLTVSNWTDTSFDLAIGSSRSTGSYQLAVTNAAGNTTVNGLTIHVLNTGGAMSAFPSSNNLDTFGSNGGTSNSLSNSWTATPSAWARVGGRAVNNLVSNASVASTALWNQSSFGPNQEAWVDLSRLGPAGAEQGLVLKSASLSGAAVRVVVTTGGNIDVRYSTNGTTWTAVTDSVPASSFAAGNRLGVRVFSTGLVEIYRSSTLVGTADISGWGATNNHGGGSIGLYSNLTAASPNQASFDNFGGGSFNAVFQVGPGKPYDPNAAENALDPMLGGDHAIQHALNDAAAAGDSIVVVYPGTPVDRINPRGAYFENLIINKKVKLQGVGSGGVRSDGTTVRGSILDGSAFAGDSKMATDWYTLIDGLTWEGNQTINDGAVISIFGKSGDFASSANSSPSFKATIDGFDIRGGDQQGFPGNLNVIGGGNTGLPANVVTQGGAIFANSYARYLQITNNVIENNGAGYGTVRIGTPDITGSNQNENQHVTISNNRIIQNGGTNLAGGIGLFSGSDNYVVQQNDICGNFSAEYGGGITAMGSGGTIQDNRIWFNRSYDEGGGVMIAGELPNDPTLVSAGSGATTIVRNLIQANLSNDDGGGLRFLMAGTAAMTVSDNMIVNNVSTHEGGGVALNDTTNVRFFNNTVMKNLTTATAVTSNGQPAPAGLSTSDNSGPLQATLPIGSATFSNPLLFNNIFWDNHAGTKDVLSTTGVVGLGLPGDVIPDVSPGAAPGATTPRPVNNWDMANADAPTDPLKQLSPTNSVLQPTSNGGVLASPTNKLTDPNVVSPYETVVAFNNWRTNPNLIGSILVGLDLPPERLGDYHLKAGSVAINAGATSKTVGSITQAASITDIDNGARNTPRDIGADEYSAPVVPFPSTAILDRFNRTSGSLTGWNNPSKRYSLASQLPSPCALGTQSTCVQATAGSITPFTRKSLYGANQEAYVTLKNFASSGQQGLVLKSSSTGSSMILVQRTLANTVQVYTKAPGQGFLKAGLPIDIRPTNNTSAVRLGARVTFDGTITVYSSSSTSSTWVLKDTRTTTFTNWPKALREGGGLIGLRVVSASGAVGYDDFGGGSMK
jgi:hypothetical protein